MRNRDFSTPLFTLLRSELNMFLHEMSSDFLGEGMGKQEGREESIVHVLSYNI